MGTIGFAMALAAPTACAAAEIKVLTSRAMNHVLTELAGAFQRSSQHKVVLILAPPAEINRRIVNGEIVARGEAELGIQLISEIVSVPGAKLLGPLPAELKAMTAIAAGIVTTASEPDAARLLLTLLTSPAAAAVIKATGMDPGS
jgi:ABC-type molybdate transport system substrate-binding protein